MNPGHVDGLTERRPSQLEPVRLASLAVDSRSGAVWTLVSRVTGFGRVAAIAAVLGPTHFGNLFQVANVLPNILYELLIGTLLVPMLVPALERAFATDVRAVRRLAGGFCGILLSVLSLVAALTMVASPQVASLLTAAVPEAAVRDQLQPLGRLLVVLLMPQIVLYGLIALCVAVQNARGRFAWAAGAPVIENVGTMLVMGAVAIVFGIGLRPEDIPTSCVVLLSAGSTASVALHAIAQWWGAHRCGVPVLPRAGWRDAGVIGIARMAVLSSVSSVLGTTSYLGLLVVAARVPGGTVAVQIGINFLFLPGAICARPVAAALLPRLSHSFAQGDMTSFYQTYRSGLALTAFVALPASFLCFAIPDVLAYAISYGRMASPAGIELVTAAIGGMALGILGDSFFRVSTSASYARHDASAPLWALTLQAILVMAGMALAVTAQATAVVWALTLFTSAGNLAAAAVLHVRQMRPSGQRVLLDVRRLVGNVTAALLAAGVAILAARWAGRDLDDSYASVFTALTAGTAGLSTYLCLQWFFGSVELRQLLSGVDRFIPRSTSCRPSLPRTAPRGSTGGSRRAH